MATTRDCNTCQHRHRAYSDSPCWGCIETPRGWTNWQPAPPPQIVAEYERLEAPKVGAVSWVPDGTPFPPVAPPVLCEYCGKEPTAFGVSACAECRKMELAIRSNPLAARKMLRKVTHELMDLEVAPRLQDEV